MSQNSTQRRTLSLLNVMGEDVVFDFDGTLLHGDLGETVFYRLLLDEMGVRKQSHPPSPGTGPSPVTYDHRNKAAQVLGLYQAFLQQGKKERAYKLTARFTGHYSEDDIRALAASILQYSQAPSDLPCSMELPRGMHIEATLRYGARMRPEMVDLVKRLMDHGARTWIVSVSPQPVIEAYCDLIGLPRSSAIGTTISRENCWILRFPWDHARAEVLHQVGLKKPLIAFGNGLEDVGMLQLAAQQVVMADGDPALLEIARQRQWVILDPAMRLVWS